MCGEGRHRGGYTALLLKFGWTVASFGLQSRLAKDKGGITGGSGTSPDDGPDPPVIAMERE